MVFAVCNGDECYMDHLDAEDPTYMGFEYPLDQYGRYTVCAKRFDHFFFVSGDHLLPHREPYVFHSYTYNSGDSYGVYLAYNQWTPRLYSPLQSGCIIIDVYDSFAHLKQEETILVTIPRYEDTLLRFAVRNSTFCVTHSEIIPAPLSTFKKECSPTPSKALDKVLATFKGFLPFNL
jgi:hypothetical protein